MSQRNQRLLNSMKIKTQFIQNLLDANKFVRKIYGLLAYIGKLERSQINNFNFHYKKKEKIKPKISIRKEINISMEISELEGKKKTLKNNKTKTWFLYKLSN